VALPVPDVALLAGRSHEDRTETVRHAEAPREFLIPGDVLVDLRGCHPLDRPVEHLILGGQVRHEDVAGGETDHESRGERAPAPVRITDSTFGTSDHGASRLDFLGLPKFVI
jgi:hypothetical protein